MIFTVFDHRLTLVLPFPTPQTEPLGRPSMVAVFGIILLTVALGLIDLRRRREHVLLANLGVGRAATAALMLIPPVVFEVLMALVAPL